MNDLDIFKSIGDLNMLIFKRISEKYKRFGYDITPVHGSIIKAIYDNGNLCQKDIEQFVSCNKSTLSSILDTMEKNDLIKRVEDSNDSRKKVIYLTDKAVEIVDIVEDDRNYIENLLEKSISKDELISFCNVLSKFIENLERV